MFAQAIHRASPRREKPLVAINCAAVATNLLESELFGHKKGAFTGADRDEAVRQRQFREDLFYRMSVITIPIPPLRERRADIVPIAARLLERINTQFRTEERGYQDKSLSDSAIAFVKRHDWPGNVRQLYNVLLQAAVMSEENSLTRSDIISALGEISAGRPVIDLREHALGDGFKLEDLLNDLHRHYLRRAMDEAHGVKSRAARLLGIDNYQTLDAQLKRLKVDGE